MSLQATIQNTPLPSEVKNMLLQRVATEGETPEVVQVVKDALQEYIDSEFAKLGITLDPNNPEVQAIAEKLNATISEIDAELSQELKEIDIQAAAAQVEANKALDAVQVQNMKSEMTT